MRSLLSLLLFISFLCAENLIPVTMKYQFKNGDIWEYNASIFKEDSVTFFSETSSQDTRRTLLQGEGTIHEQGILYCSGNFTNGRLIGEKKFFRDGKLYQLSSTNRKGIQKKRITYNSDGTVETIERFPNKLFKNYRLGIQPPTLIDVAYPTGLTFSSFNFHCDIPMPEYSYKKRLQLVFASEVGVNGVAGRIGLSPFMTDTWMNRAFHQTPITLNGSFTYIWRDREYNNLSSLEAGRWYVGGDVDFSYILGHIRFGAFRLIRSDVDRPWKFMFSIGLSPGLLFFPLWLPTAG